MAELTQLGKFLRKLRIDRGELLRDMATKLGVAMSFLSSVENGKKGMPSEWVQKISELYELPEQARKEFDAAVAESEKGVDIKFTGLSPEERKLSAAFARKIKNLLPEEQKVLQSVLF